MSISDVQPSVWYFGLAVLIVLTGFLLFSWSVLSGIAQMEAGLVRFVAPGSAGLDLEQSGEYTIFYENQSSFEDRFYSTGEQISGLQIRVVELASGRSTPTRPASSGITYSFAGRSGRAIMAFDVERPGTYRIDASYAGGTGPEVVLAVSHGFAEGIFSLVLTSLAVLFSSLLLGLGAAIWTYTGRKKARAQQQMEERLIRGGS